jgi:bacterioferritin
MKGNKQIIALLNKALGVELVAIHHYFLHARMYKVLIYRHKLYT